MAHYLIFTKVVTLTLPFIRFSKNKLPVVLGPEDIICQNIRTIGPAVWSVHREKTDRQTDRGDQYTLRKSKISQSNKGHHKRKSGPNHKGRGANSNRIWNIRKQMISHNKNDEYDTKDEKGRKIIDPTETKEHVAEYFEKSMPSKGR